jgi:tRNA(Ile)-lysidine synthase
VPSPSSVISAVESAVRRAARDHAFWSAGATLVVGVSGGPDSLCLLGALHALTRSGVAEAPGALVVAHLDHGLRGAEGARDAAWVAEFAARLDLRYVTETADVKRLALDEQRSLEDAARCVRYAFLRRVAYEVAAERICVGHTRDDQAETVAMHWLRGSGLAGLAGMAPLEGAIARPLLDIARQDTEAYCAGRGWEPRRDLTNADPAFLRNRIRRELLPALAAYNPRITRVLTDNAALIAADDAYLEALTSAAWSAVLLEETAERVTLALPPLREVPGALRHRLLRRACARLTRGEHLPEARHILGFDALLARGAAGRALNLPGGVRLALSYDHIALALVADETPRERQDAGEMPTEDVPLPIPGAVELPALGWRVRAWISDRPAGLEAAEPAPPETLSPFPHAGTRADLGRAELRVYLDADLAGEPLIVRAWRPGDRFQPLGMAQTKKLQDYFADAKVPRALRHQLPLVAGPRHILWIGGQRIDERARVSLATQRVLVLQLEPLE